jgi:hypothetical protein
MAVPADLYFRRECVHAMHPAAIRDRLKRILDPLELPLTEKPGWVGINFGGNYTVHFFLIDTDILFVSAQGRPTHEDLEKVMEFDRSLRAEEIP